MKAVFGCPSLWKVMTRLCGLAIVNYILYFSLLYLVLKFIDNG